MRWTLGYPNQRGFVGWGFNCYYGVESEDIVTGEVRAYCGSAAPSGWVLCDGSSYATADKPDLFSIIGYTYGGSGANFNVPDFQGRMLIGAGSGAGLTARSRGDSSGAEKITDVPEHNHDIECNSNVSDPNTDTDPLDRYCANSDATGEDLYADTPTGNMGPTENTGTAGGVDVMNPFGVVNFIIKE